MPSTHALVQIWDLIWMSRVCTVESCDLCLTKTCVFYCRLLWCRPLSTPPCHCTRQRCWRSRWVSCHWEAQAQWVQVKFTVYKQFYGEKQRSFYKAWRRSCLQFYYGMGKWIIMHNVSHFLLVFQYISANPNVQGAYMPQYPPIQAVPVSILAVKPDRCLFLWFLSWNNCCFAFYWSQTAVLWLQVKTTNYDKQTQWLWLLQGSERKTQIVFAGKRDASTSGFFQQLILLQSTQQVITGMKGFLSFSLFKNVVSMHYTPK